MSAETFTGVTCTDYQNHSVTGRVMADVSKAPISVATSHITQDPSLQKLRCQNIKRVLCGRKNSLVHFTETDIVSEGVKSRSPVRRV
jgi:hypothetical protein